MNKNPLFIKSSLIGKIPFIKGKTASLYGRYLSNHRFNKIMDSGSTETVSAYTMGANYQIRDSQLNDEVEPINFVFDETQIDSSRFFSESEWISLGMVLRAYKEVEGVNLLHLYNCLYSGEGNTVKGFIVSGRIYTLYSSTQLPVKITIYDPITPENKITGVLRSISRNNPTFILSGWGKYSQVGKLLNIELEFTGSTYQPCTLVEGKYKGLSLSELSRSKANEVVPENLGIGEYSDKLVEFFAGTLLTPLSDPRLISNTSFKLPGSGATVWEKVVENTKGLYNQDGYLDRRNKV